MSGETVVRLSEGDVMPDFTFDTPFAAGQSLSEAVQKTPKTALLFLRYYGCTLCQYEMHQLAENYGQITAVGGQVLVVLQSAPAGIAGQIGPDSLPFTIICDPQAALYEKFGIHGKDGGRRNDAQDRKGNCRRVQARCLRGQRTAAARRLCGGQRTPHLLCALRKERRRYPGCPFAGGTVKMTFSPIVPYLPGTL